MNVRLLWPLLVLPWIGCVIVDDPLAGPQGTPCETEECRYESTAVPVIDLPEAMRETNWGTGSCVHASTVHLLRWQGLEEMADWWRAQYESGEYPSRLHTRLDAAGLRYAYTISADRAFLQWAVRTRRGAGVTYFTNHAVNLVHLDDRMAGLLDNNRIDEIVWIPREEFLTKWQQYGGWAWTVVYDPPPPRPYY